MQNITALLEELKASPYEEVHITAPHTGQISFAKIRTGDVVYGPSGTWKEKPGTLLASLDRERNPKPVCAPRKGVISEVRRELDLQRAGAGQILFFSGRGQKNPGWRPTFRHCA